MLHRPGNELRRLTPRNNDKLLFDGIPWVGRAQDEHDAFAQALRDREVEVLYLGELLSDTLRDYLRSALAALDPAQLAEALMAGVRNDEVRAGGLVTSLLAEEDFLIDPLPNLLFTRDSSV